MDGLILLLILIPIIFFILLLTILNRSGEQRRLLESLYDKIKQLNNEVGQLSKELRDSKEKKNIPLQEEQQVSVPKPMVHQPAVGIQTLAGAIPSKEPENIKTVQPGTPVIKSFPASQQQQQKTTRDLEKFIGENLVNKIGIAVLVLGIAFFVKYAIDKNWLQEGGRVLVGLICGAVLVGIAHRIRNSYRSFSSVLVGGGLSVFYFTIAFAFHQYHLIGQTAAFIIMVIISAACVALSVFYNRQELAILAAIGGFITPFLVSTGNENYIALFTYLCILNTGLMVLAWFKRWPAINIIALFFTSFIFAGWLTKRLVFEDEASFPYKHALLFATLFYALFMVMNMINSLRLRNKFTAFDFIILLTTNFLYYAAGILILSYSGKDRDGLFTLLLGVFNLLLALFFFRRQNVDKNFVSLLLGTAITFISLSVALELEGNHITLFWAAEMVILYWLFQRSKIRLLRQASVLVGMAMLVSLFINAIHVYLLNNQSLLVVINKGFITNLGVVIALLLYRLLGSKDEEAAPLNNRLRKIALVLAVSIGWLAGIMEIGYQFSFYYPSLPVYAIYMQLFTCIMTVLLLWIFRKDPSFPVLQVSFTVFCFLIYLLHIESMSVTSKTLLDTSHSELFMGHWPGVVLLLILLYRLIYFFRKDQGIWSAYETVFTVLSTTAIILVVSIEAYHLILWLISPNNADLAWWNNLYYKAGLSILWGVCSFVLVWLGIKYRMRTLRIISLSLFTITILKLFLYDIRKIPPGGKIAAFILLGILLLIVSFMYQRVKEILFKNDTEESENE